MMTTATTNTTTKMTANSIHSQMKDTAAQNVIKLQRFLDNFRLPETWHENILEKYRPLTTVFKINVDWNELSFLSLEQSTHQNLLRKYQLFLLGHLYCQMQFTTTTATTTSNAKDQWEMVPSPAIDWIWRQHRQQYESHYLMMLQALLQVYFESIATTASSSSGPPTKRSKTTATTSATAAASSTALANQALLAKCESKAKEMLQQAESDDDLLSSKTQEEYEIQMLSKLKKTTLLMKIIYPPLSLQASKHLPAANQQGNHDKAPAAIKVESKEKSASTAITTAVPTIKEQAKTADTVTKTTQLPDRPHPTNPTHSQDMKSLCNLTRNDYSEALIAPRSIASSYTMPGSATRPRRAVRFHRLRTSRPAVYAAERRVSDPLLQRRMMSKLQLQDTFQRNRQMYLVAIYSKLDQHDLRNDPFRRS